MAIPKSTEFMSPMLEWLQDREAKHYKTFTPFIVNKLKISEEDQGVLLSSGQPLFENRYGWARLYLTRAGLLEVPQRAMLKITDDGLSLFKSGKIVKSVKDLEQFSKYKEWINKEKTQDHSEINTVIEERSPEELIETSKGHYP